MTTNNKFYNNGIGFFGALTVLFIGLKLTNFINWSWWLVLLPMYWILALLASGGIVYICVYFMILIIDFFQKKILISK